MSSLPPHSAKALAYILPPEYKGTNFTGGKNYSSTYFDLYILT
jgi:hypothetical protein